MKNKKKNGTRALLTSQADMSFDDLECELQEELQEKFGLDAFGTPLYVLVEAFPDYVIARGPGGKLYQLSYSVDDQDEATLGDPQEVETAFVPVSQSGTFVIAEAGVAVDDWIYPVQVMQAGWAHGAVAGQKNVPHYFTPSVVAEVAAAVNGAKFGRQHPASGTGSDQPERIAGWMSNGKLVGETAVGDIHLLKSETKLQSTLSAARAAGKLDLFGVSMLGFIQFKAGKVEGKDCLVSEKLGKLISVDLCAEAGAGGKFLQYAASKAVLAEISQMQKESLVKTSESGSADSAARKTGAMMKERIKKLIESLRKHDAGRATALTTEFAAVKDEQLSDFMLTVSEAVTEASEKASQTATTHTELTALVTESRAALDEAKKIKSANLVETKLVASKLPAPAMNLVRQAFVDDKGEQLIVAESAVDNKIKQIRDAFAAYSNIGRIGAGRVEVGMETRDKAQLRMDMMLGVKESGQKLYVEMMAKSGIEKPLITAEAGARPFRGIKEAYMLVTGDTGLSFGSNGAGGFTKVTEAIATTDFPNILLDSMFKRLIQDYAEVGLNGLEQLITEGPPLSDYRTQSRIREGYMQDFPIVAEGAPYLELTKPTDEKVTYAPQKRGGLLTVSEETIRADDLGKIKQFPMRLARAGRHTLKTFITNFFINNPNYVPDGTAWFGAGHNNLATAPLSIDALIAQEVIQMKQTEKDSGNRLERRISWLMVPVDLAPIAWQINNAQFYNPGQGIQQPNPFYLRFGPAGTGKNAPPGIIVNGLLTDTNDWYYGVDITEVPIFEVGYIDGINTPQIFLADLQTQGAQFTNDQIQYKPKFPFGGAILDFRGAGKSVVP
ncbi:MAG: hypothetical protein ACJ71W_00660 [Terriglobales bacterium]